MLVKRYSTLIINHNFLIWQELVFTSFLYLKYLKVLLLRHFMETMSHLTVLIKVLTSSISPKQLQSIKFKSWSSSPRESHWRLGWKDQQWLHRSYRTPVFSTIWNQKPFINTFSEFSAAFWDFSNTLKHAGCTSSTLDWLQNLQMPVRDRQSRNAGPA